MDSHGLVNWAGEVLGAEAGQEACGYVGQEGHQFDLKPEFDEVRVVQVLLGHRRRVRLAEDLLKVRRQLGEVLQAEKEALILILITNVFKSSCISLSLIRVSWFLTFSYKF